MIVASKARKYTTTKGVFECKLGIDLWDLGWYNLGMLQVDLKSVGYMSSDVEQLAEIISHKEVYLPFNAGCPGGKEKNYGEIRATIAYSKPAYVAKIGDRVVGFVGFGDLLPQEYQNLRDGNYVPKEFVNSPYFDFCKAIYYFVDPQFQGLGIGTKMVELALDHYFKSPYCCSPVITANYFVYGENNENVASHKLLEKLGFECYFSTIKYNRCYAEPTHLTHMYLTREMFENRNSQK